MRSCHDDGKRTCMKTHEDVNGTRDAEEEIRKP